MIGEFVDVFGRLDPLSYWFTVIGAMAFAALPFRKGDSDSDWTDFALWGIAVYLGYYALLNLHRFLADEPTAMFHFVSSTFRWTIFVCTAIVTTGTLRWLMKRRRKKDNDRLSQ